MQRVDPPAAVIDAFNDVQRARADQQRARNEAEAYRNDILPRARRGRADQAGGAGLSRADREPGSGAAARFLSLDAAYKQSREITARRLYLDTMEDVLKSAGKVLVDPSGKAGASVVPFLSLTAAQLNPAADRAADPGCDSASAKESRAMSLRALMIAIVALAFAAWLGSQCLYTVDQGSAALLVRLGQVVATIEEPGLYFKAPLIDTVTQYDKRLLPLEPPVDQIILGDQKRIVVETFARFRINSPLRFYQTVGTVEQARVNLSQMIGSALRKQLGTVPLSALLTPEREKIAAQVRDEAAVQADALGVQLVDVRLRRADLPTETSQAIYERMTSERVRKPMIFGRRVRNGARKFGPRPIANGRFLSEAQRESEIRRGAADAEASRILADAYAQDPGFFDLYRTLQVYRAGLTVGAATLLLSPSSELR